MTALCTGVRCDEGSFGAVGGCEAVEVTPGHLVVRTGPVAAGDAVTVRAVLGAPVAAPAAPPAPGPVSGTGAPLLVPGPARLRAGGRRRAGDGPGAAVRRAGGGPGGLRGKCWEPRGAVPPPGRVDVADLVADAPVRLTPPRLLTPAQGGVLLAEKVKAAHKSAWLLGQAQAGTVALEGDPSTPTLRWIGGAGAAENGALLTIFAGRSEVQLGSYDKDFASGWNMVGAELGAWRSSSGLWSSAGERRRRWAIGIGILLVPLGMAALVFLAYQWSTSQPSVGQLVPLTLPVGVGLGLLGRSWELRVRTAEGSALYVEVEAFRRHLAEAESTDVERAATAGLLHDYLAWAVALGVSKAWRSAVERSSVEPGTSYDPGMLYIASSLESTTSSAATAPSSDGDGGGGGGGAGGGGGGGGGGSW